MKERKWNSNTISEELEMFGCKYISHNRDLNKRLRVDWICPSGNKMKNKDWAKWNARHSKCSCEDCSGHIKWTDQRIREYVESKGFILLEAGVNKGYDKDLHIKCKKNLSETHTTLHNLIARDGKCSCEKCCGRKKNTKEHIVKVLEESNYRYVSHYYDSGKHLRVKSICPNGHEYDCKFSHFEDGVRCSQCKQKSKGEAFISKYLDKFSIPYTKEYIFDDCIYINKLKFDFYVNIEGLRPFIIEYDGEQHFAPQAFANMTKEKAEDEFAKTQIRDEIKNEYCKKNDIPIIRIPYTIKGRAIIVYLNFMLWKNYRIMLRKYCSNTDGLNNMFTEMSKQLFYN